jgi:hypothetical protein
MNEHPRRPEEAAPAVPDTDDRAYEAPAIEVIYEVEAELLPPPGGSGTR